MVTTDDDQSEVQDAQRIVARSRSDVQADDVSHLFRLPDRFETSYPALAATGIDLEPVLICIKAVYCFLPDQDKRIVHRLGHRGLSRLRARAKPPKHHWRWYLGRHITARRKRRLGRLR